MEIIKLPSAVKKERKRFRSTNLKKNKNAYSRLKNMMVPNEIAQFASTDCPFRMSGAGSSVEAVWVSGRIFYLFSGVRSRIFLPFISRR